MQESKKNSRNLNKPSTPKKRSKLEPSDIRLCSVCNTRPARDKRTLCRTCETDKYMIQKYEKYVDDFSRDKSRFGVMIYDYIKFLDQSYGNQKREIAYRIKYTLEAFSTGGIKQPDEWGIDDLIHIEDYRATLSVQKRTALFHFVEFIKDRYALHEATDEIRIQNVIKEIPCEFREISIKYLEFLQVYRKLKHWTRYQLAYSLKYFFCFISTSYTILELRQIGRDHIISYLRYLQTNSSQRNSYTRFIELSSFFKWALKHKLVFSNPCLGIDMSYGYELTQSLTDEEQQMLLKRWISPDTDPREALIGILSLIYACSPEELRYLPLNCIEEDRIVISGRSVAIKLTPVIERLFVRYLDWRQALCKGSKNDYLIVSRISYKRNVPISHSTLLDLFKGMGVNLRVLRSTRFQDIARSGHLKLLEGLGLKFEGTQAYIRSAAPVLLMGIEKLQS